MERQLTDAQIARARELRAKGWSYADIKSALGVDVEPVTIRTYCDDVPVEGVVRRRKPKGISTGKDGRTIRPFTPAEDTRIKDWVLHAHKIDPPETMADLAKRLDRRRHSVAARIRTLKKHGELPT